MPGNKNSGRRKKQVENSSEARTITTNNNNNNSNNNKRGRPKKSSKPVEGEIPHSHNIEISNDEVSASVTSTSTLARASNNVTELKSRHSDISNFYNEHLGSALEGFPARVLPRNRCVLRRYRSLRTDQHAADQRLVSLAISKEVMDLWERSAIPHIDFKACAYKIQKIVSRWTNAKKDRKSDRTSPRYQKELNNLLDLRPESLSTLPALKAELKKRGKNWEDDYNFFKGQMVYPPTSFMSPSTDHVLAATTRKREERNKKVSEKIIFMLNVHVIFLMWAIHFDMMISVDISGDIPISKPLGMLFKGRLKHKFHQANSFNLEFKHAHESHLFQAQLFMERNHGDGGNDSDGLKISSNDDISEENIVQSDKRRSAVDAKTKVRQLSPDIEDGDDPRASCFKRAAEGFNRPPDIDVDWQLPPLAKRRLREKPKTVTLTLPAKEIPTLLASTSTVTKTSTRHELKLVSTMLVSGGADLNNVSLSKSTIYRQRKSTVTSAATGIREKIKSYAFSDSKHKFFVLHWDGKIIQYINGTTEERLAIALSAPNFIPGQFLAAPVIANGKGNTMANCVHEITTEYGFLNEVEAMVFDTTASNTGVYKGSVSGYEKKVCNSSLPHYHSPREVIFDLQYSNCQRQLIFQH